MGASHTPGPWAGRFDADDWSVDAPRRGPCLTTEAVGSKKRPYPIALVVQHDKQIYGDGDAELSANVALIAAAPDMLSALKRLDQFWTAEHPAGPTSPAYGLGRLTNETCEVWSDIRAAIAKAEASNA